MKIFKDLVYSLRKFVHLTSNLMSPAVGGKTTCKDKMFPYSVSIMPKYPTDSNNNCNKRVDK